MTVRPCSLKAASNRWWGGGGGAGPVGPGWSGNKLQLNTIQYNTKHYILFENFYLLAPLANTRLKHGTPTTQNRCSLTLRINNLSQAREARSLLFAV